jgi:hypothetical protein
MTANFEPTHARRIGPFTVGEIPGDLVVTFEDDDGNAIADISGWTVKFVGEEIGGDKFSEDGEVSSGTNAEAKYVWDGTLLTETGFYRAQLWIGNGTKRFASIVFEFLVEDGPGDTPSI